MIKRGCQTAKITRTVLLSHTGSGGEVRTTSKSPKVLHNWTGCTPLSDMSWFQSMYLRSVLEGVLTAVFHMTTNCSECARSLSNCRHCVCFFSFPKPQETFSHFQFMTIASSRCALDLRQWKQIHFISHKSVFRRHVPPMLKTGGSVHDTYGTNSVLSLSRLLSLKCSFK